MLESVLNALMRLFAVGALISDTKFNNERSRYVIYNFLIQTLNIELADKFIRLYEQYYQSLRQEFDSDVKKLKTLSANYVKILKISEQINETLHLKEKIIVIIRLLEFFAEKGSLSEEEEDFAYTVASTFKISDQEFGNIRDFVLNKFESIESDRLLMISPIERPGFNYIIDSNLDRPLIFLFIPSVELLIFKYFGQLQLRLTSRPIKANNIYIFGSGSVIRGGKIQPIYQTFILGKFLHKENLIKVTLVAKNIEFYYPNTDVGLHRFTFKAESGELVGIMGASGTGKSTFLNLLIGKYKISSGKIVINGYDIYQDRDKIIPLIGYVPQDDLLIEELTVYENLYFTAKLCLGNLDDEAIRQRVDKTLKDLELYDIKDLTVGSVLNKYISGGQRKRLNIALELIREPAILLVDEPTSGLSSMDSENVMHLLKRQSINGKLVIVNIHQPSSDIFKLFDQIVILDKGGYPVYRGNPLDGIIYFKQIENFADSDIAECPTCGTVKPELIFEVLEDKVLDQFGKYTNYRRTSPREWYILYKVNIQAREKINIPPKHELPSTDFKPPSKFKQLLIFIKRDIKSKLANLQYMVLTLLEAPVLAVILAYLTRTPNDRGVYVLSDNYNLPVFLFMAVVVALFLGMIISAQEILKDRKILEKQRFLALSKGSYLFSKFLIMMFISFYQMMVFVLISNSILKIHGLFLRFWYILFSTEVAAAVLGLIVSSMFDSAAAIYITIPLILIPEMILGGAMINFNDLPWPLNSPKYTPVIADFMQARWAYEALTVTEFKDNPYEKIFFELDKKHSNALYKSAFYFPELMKISRQIEQGQDAKFYLCVLKNELHNVVEKDTFLQKYDWSKFDDLSLKNFLSKKPLLDDYFRQAQNDYSNLANEYAYEKEDLIDSLIRIMGKEKLVEFKRANYNNKLASIVLNLDRVKQIGIAQCQVVRYKDPIFMRPYSRWGRAQMYASEKILGNWSISTFYFNTAVLWLFTIVMFILLYSDIFRKIIHKNRFG